MSYLPTEAGPCQNRPRQGSRHSSLWTPRELEDGYGTMSGSRQSSQNRQLQPDMPEITQQSFISPQRDGPSYGSRPLSLESEHDSDTPAQAQEIDDYYGVIKASDLSDAMKEVDHYMKRIYDYMRANEWHKQYMNQMRGYRNTMESQEKTLREVSNLLSTGKGSRWIFAGSIGASSRGKREVVPLHMYTAATKLSLKLRSIIEQERLDVEKTSIWKMVEEAMEEFIETFQDLTAEMEKVDKTTHKQFSKRYFWCAATLFSAIGTCVRYIYIGNNPRYFNILSGPDTRTGTERLAIDGKCPCILRNCENDETGTLQRFPDTQQPGNTRYTGDLGYDPSINLPEDNLLYQSPVSPDWTREVNTREPLHPGSRLRSTVDIQYAQTPRHIIVTETPRMQAQGADTYYEVQSAEHSEGG